MEVVIVRRQFYIGMRGLSGGGLFRGGGGAVLVWQVVYQCYKKN